MKPLHDKKHTPAKRFLSLLCILALCLGLLPATALAAEEIKLFIGGQQITDSGCYENQNGTWTKVDGTEPANGQFYYDAATFTLTLNQAEITHDQTVTVAEGYKYQGSVIVFSQTDDVSLKIVVSQGTSTITGTGGIRVESTTGNASLSIKGPGSLDVEPKGSNSGITLCSSKNTNLDINGADVTASSPAQYGVYLISDTDATSTSTITVNNGSLTTGGNGNVGIYYNWSGTSNAGTSSLTVSGNAVVDTRNSQIMTKNEEKGVQVGAGSDGNGGIVFNGKSGTVYGDVTLQEDLEIGEGETLTIGKDASLTVPDGKTLTNDGTINVESGGKLEGTTTGNGTLKIAPTITTQPQDVEVKENETATFTVNATGSEPLAYQWQQSTDNGQSWTEISGATSDSYTTDAATLAMNNYQYQCVVSNSAGSVTSSAATLTVDPVSVTGVTLDQAELALYTGESKPLTATVEPDNATKKNVTWSSNNEAVATVDNNGKVTAKAAGTATITVTTEDGEKTATCTVTVTDKTYTISAAPTALNFGSAYTGYAQPAAQTVTLTNTGNQPVTLTQPASTSSFEIGTLSKTELAPNATATFTIQPKDKLPRGSYSEQIAISNTNGEKATITATFTVKEPPYTGKYSYEVSTSVGDHGSLTVDRYATEGEKVTIIVTPDQAYKLDELVVTANGKDVELTANGDGTYTFTMPSADVRITATFAEDPDWTEPEEPATDVSDLFIDIAPDAWYKDAVQYAYDNGLMTGVSATEFAPEATTTRAMIVSILARLEGVKSAEAAGFADVTDEWYATAVNWAANVGVVNGYEDNTFRPNTAITREQLAAILMNYAAYKGYDVSARADLSHYSDADSISSWANDVLLWAVAEGLLTGVTDDTIAPQAHATRAQVAAILQRFLSE